MLTDQLDQLYLILRSRRRSHFRVAHTLHDQNGYHILDLNVHAGDLETAKAKMMDLLSTIPPESFLPAADRSLWVAFFEAPNVHHEKIPTPLGRRRVIGIFVRGLPV
jgi:hypothetical protein